jgi:hypothetical protein
VIASLWRVDDRSTSALMRALYAALARGTPPAAALQQAQAQVRDTPGGAWRHPFHWAGFTFITTAATAAPAMAAPTASTAPTAPTTPPAGPPPLATRNPSLIPVAR